MSNLVTNIQGYSIHDGPGIRTVVFFKGCGLKCRWCSNPECISARPEIGFYKHLCTACGKCADMCPTGALICKGRKLQQIIRAKCDGCGICSSVCAYKALVIYGKRMSAAEIYDAVSRDKMFYETSGGGVTLSGGETLLKPDLASELLEKCSQEGIHTCIETSGYASEASFKQVLPFTDYVLFDLKLIDPGKHRLYTGKSNKIIISNARTAAESGAEVLFRMPLIPGINDNTENISGTANFLHTLGKNAGQIELMPYHRLGKGKYESLDLPYRLPDLLPPDAEYLETIKRTFEDLDIKCTISK